MARLPAEQADCLARVNVLVQGERLGEVPHGLAGLGEREGADLAPIARRPRPRAAWSPTGSCGGRHATSWIGFRGVVSSTMRSPVSPWTHTPLVKITVLGPAPRRPASISASIAVLSLATPLGEYSNAAWTRTAHSAATSA